MTLLRTTGVITRVVYEVIQVEIFESYLANVNVDHVFLFAFEKNYNSIIQPFLKTLLIK
jgi:hypothetical protein